MEEVQKNLLACGVFYRANHDRPRSDIVSSNAYKTLTKNLKLSYEVILALQRLDNTDWLRDEKNNGFLVKNDGALLIRAPAHLAYHFPDGESTGELFRLGRLIRTSEKSILNISGSNTFGKVLNEVDDIDFCEYIPCDQIDLADYIDKRLSSESVVVCSELSCHPSKTKYKPPFSGVISGSDIVKNLNPDCENKSTLKMDFIASRDDSRPYELTNLMLYCNPNYDGASRKRTFIHQEVQIGPVDYTPKNLMDAFEIGRYINWLINEIREHRRSGNTLKLLKRVLSLSGICSMGDIFKKTVELLNKSSILYEKELTTLERLEEIVRNSKFHEPFKTKCLDDILFHKEITLDKISMFSKIESRKFKGGIVKESIILVGSLNSRLRKLSYEELKI